jgi:hypothetical protein
MRLLQLSIVLYVFCVFFFFLFIFYTFFFYIVLFFPFSSSLYYVCVCVLVSRHNPILPFSILLLLLFEKSPHSFKMSIYYYVTLHSCPRLNSSSTK